MKETTNKKVYRKVYFRLDDGRIIKIKDIKAVVRKSDNWIVIVENLDWLVITEEDKNLLTEILLSETEEVEFTFDILNTL